MGRPKARASWKAIPNVSPGEGLIRTELRPYSTPSSSGGMNPRGTTLSRRRGWAADGLETCGGRLRFDVRPAGDANGEDVGPSDLPAEGVQIIRNALAADQTGDDEPREDVRGDVRAFRRDTWSRRDDEDRPPGEASFPENVRGARARYEKARGPGEEPVLGPSQALGLDTGDPGVGAGQAVDDEEEALPRPERARRRQGRDIEAVYPELGPRGVGFRWRDRPAWSSRSGNPPHPGPEEGTCCKDPPRRAASPEARRRRRSPAPELSRRQALLTLGLRLGTTSPS